MIGSPLERFMSKFQISETGCWEWTGFLVNGYGSLRVGAKKVMAHRWSYEHFIGPIPDGLEIDHVKDRGCTSRACVNPAHLEAVTRQVNLARGRHINRDKTHCPAGHPYDEENTYHIGTARRCRTCVLSQMKTYYWRDRQDV